MAKPIIWTVICVICVVLRIFSVGGTALYMNSFMIVAILCAVLQWAVYFKNKRNGGNS